MKTYKIIGNTVNFGIVGLITILGQLNLVYAAPIKYIPKKEAKYPIELVINSVTLENLEDIAKKITVKVISGSQNWGSGVLIYAGEDTYTVITNDHVIRSGSITVVTFDQKTYKGTMVENLRLQGIDLAIVEFQSKSDYNVASIGNYQSLVEGDFVFTSGYPLEVNNANRSYGLKTIPGNIKIKLDQPLTRAYQIGYNNAVESGMSGGPVLDINGRLVAINGRNSREAILSPRFQNQSLPSPCPPLKNIMMQASWGIPINVAIGQSKKIADLNLNYYLPSSKTLHLGIASVVVNTFITRSDKSLKINADKAKQCKPSS